MAGLDDEISMPAGKGVMVVVFVTGTVVKLKRVCAGHSSGTG